MCVTTIGVPVGDSRGVGGHDDGLPIAVPAEYSDLLLAGVRNEHRSITATALVATCDARVV